MIVRIAATLTAISITAVRRAFAGTAGAALPAATGRVSKAASKAASKAWSKVSCRYVRCDAMVAAAHLRRTSSHPTAAAARDGRARRWAVPAGQASELPGRFQSAGTTMSGELSWSRSRQRCASGCSPIAAAARPRAATASRNPRLGSCDEGTGPAPFQPARRSASRPPVVADPGVGVRLHPAAGLGRPLGEGCPRQARRREVSRHQGRVASLRQLLHREWIGRKQRWRRAQQVPVRGQAALRGHEPMVTLVPEFA